MVKKIKELYQTERTWYKDPNVKFDSKEGGSPPPNHPRRCQSPNRERTQCGMWAEAGRDFCKFHGGRSRFFRRADMAKFYSQHAGTRLRELLQQAAESGDDRLQLEEEIDFSRILALRNIQLFEAACLIPENQEKTSVDTKAAAIAGARNAMSHVADLVTKAAKIRAMDVNSAIAPAIDLVVQQIVKAIEEEIAQTDQTLADRLIARIEDIHLPTSTSGPIVVIT